jgi:hypothetical protein
MQIVEFGFLLMVLFVWGWFVVWKSFVYTFVLSPIFYLFVVCLCFCGTWLADSGVGGRLC